MRSVMTQLGLQELDDGQDAAIDLWMNLVLLVALIAIVLLTQIGIPDVSMDQFEELEAQYEELDDQHSTLSDEHREVQQILTEIEGAYDEEKKAHGQARLDRDRAQASAARHEREANSWRGHATDMQQRLRAESIDLVICVDISLTMSDELAINMDTLLCIARSLPNVTTLRIGVVAFREDLWVYPLTEIKPVSVDGGQSVASLERFLGSMQAENGLADVDRALRAATAMLSGADDGVRRQCVAILGDTGPFEMKGSNPHQIDPGERESAEELVRYIQRWAAPDRRRVVACFSEDTSGANNEDRIAQQKHAASRQFFSSLASRTGGTFTENPGRLLADLLETTTNGGSQ